MRDLEDRWVRIWTKKGALLVVPEGIYHRFTLDEGNYIKAGRAGPPPGALSACWRHLLAYGSVSKGWQPGTPQGGWQDCTKTHCHASHLLHAGPAAVCGRACVDAHQPASGGAPLAPEVPLQRGAGGHRGGVRTMWPRCAAGAGRSSACPCQPALVPAPAHCWPRPMNVLAAIYLYL